MQFDWDRITAALSNSWSPKTSGRWLASNPARGQCNVAASLIHELFGGEILKTPLAGTISIIASTVGELI